METTSFLEITRPDFLFEFRYSGGSFNHQIEISALASELKGVNAALRIAISGLTKNRRIDLSADDIEIVVDPFEEGSFIKRLRLVAKHLNKNQGAYLVSIALAGLITQITGIIKTNSVSDLSRMPPQLQAQIKDSVIIELMKNKDFVRGWSAISAPLRLSDDTLSLRSPEGQPAIFNLDDKIKLDALANVEVEPIESEMSEELVGRITRVDLDATVNQLGIKIDGKGATVNCALIDDLTRDDKRNMLDKWVRIDGITTYQNGEREKIDIQNITIIEIPEQQTIPMLLKN